MEFQTMSEVPAAIAGFYHEETVSEPTGNQVEEEYTYLDEEGVEQTGTRMVDEYADVTYVVENNRSDLKSWSQVDQIIDRQKGGNDTVVDHFITKAIESDGWDYHDAYIDYLEREPDPLDEDYQEEVPGADPVEYVYSYPDDRNAWLADEPVPPTAVTVEGWKIANYEILRRAAFKDYHFQFDLMYTDMASWRDHVAAVRLQYPES